MAEVKRPNYFTSQFLVEKDFKDEQAYHVDLRRLHNQVLHSWGIATGLEVTKTGNKQVSVSPGTAIDQQGREIVLPNNPAPAPIDLASFGANADVFLTIVYREVFDQADRYQSGGVDNFTRTTERPKLEATTTAPPTDGSVIPLAQVKLDASGDVSTIDLSLRKFASAAIAPGTIGLDKLAAPVQSAINASIISVDGVSNPKGNIDLVQTNAITITPDDANNRITIGENHSARTDNPHGTTAAQVGALPVAGGTISGDLALDGNLNFTNLTGFFGGGTGDNQIGLGSLPGKKITVFIKGGSTLPTVFGGQSSALMIWPFVSGMQGLSIIAATGGVDTMSVSGTARFSGNKIGYVTDTFVNGSGKVLHTGDIVKLKSTGAVRFHGDNNRIPIPEVTLADRENDPLVIGIVCQEATPAPGELDRRTDPDDPTAIPDGGELFVVTLGTFAHCKADAKTAIEVGDLLTSSANPGHAQKATEPKIGSIIGKALEPLPQGTGYIAVFVNIQ
jgi:hypothetical protein